MKNRQTLCLFFLHLVVISNHIVTGLQCHQCQYTEDEALQDKIFDMYLTYNQYNGSLQECESSPTKDTLHDIKDEEEGDNASTTSTTEMITTTEENNSTESTTEVDTHVIKTREIMEKLGIRIPMAEEKEHLYCVYFKAYTNDGKKPVVIRGAFKSRYFGDQDKKWVDKDFEKYPMEVYWKDLFKNITTDLAGSELYMCQSNGCNAGTSLLRQFSSISSIFFSMTCLVVSRFSRLYN